MIKFEFQENQIFQESFFKFVINSLIPTQVALKIINQSKLSQCEIEKILREVKIMKVNTHNWKIIN